MTGRPRSEFERIRWLRTRAMPGGRVVVGPGDDGAVLRPHAGEDWVWTVDSLVEGVHFRAGWLSPEELGRRAVEVSLSDLAAMAARPVALLAAAELPADLPERAFRGLCEGIRAAADGAGARLAGGNLARSPGRLALTTTAIGRVRRGRAILRAGARPGDEIWTTGLPGGAGLGLAALGRWGRRGVPRGFAPYIARFARPRARVGEALWLAGRSPTAMIDTSDGLLADLGHILRESGTGADVELPAPSDAFRRLAARVGRDPVALVLAGGEDYELVVCAPPGSLTRAPRAFRRRFGIPLVKIGRVVEGRGIRVRVGGEPIEPSATGFDHFA